MELLSLPQELLEIILKKVNNALFFLLTCRNAYTLRLKIFEFPFKQHLGQIKNGEIILSNFANYFITWKGILCCDEKWRKCKDFRKASFTPIELREVKKFYVLPNREVLIILFFNGDLELIELESSQRKRISTKISDCVLGKYELIVTRKNMIISLSLTTSIIKENYSYKLDFTPLTIFLVSWFDTKTFLISTAKRQIFRVKFNENRISSLPRAEEGLFFRRRGENIYTFSPLGTELIQKITCYREDFELI